VSGPREEPAGILDTQALSMMTSYAITRVERLDIDGQEEKLILLTLIHVPVTDFDEWRHREQPPELTDTLLLLIPPRVIPGLATVLTASGLELPDIELEP
jgi:hypothetical protein